MAAKQVELHPQVEALRRQRVAAGVRPLHELTVAEARRAESAEVRADDPEPMAAVIDRSLPGPEGPLRVRLYRKGRGQTWSKPRRRPTSASTSSRSRARRSTAR